MASFEYNPIANYIALEYICPNCGQPTTSDAFLVPSPNWMAERARDSENSEEYEAICEHCNSSYAVNLYTRYDGGYGEIDDVETGQVNVHEEFDKEDYEDYELNLSSFDPLTQSNEYDKILDKLSDLTVQEQNTIHKLLFVNIIARMEALLADTLKNEVLKDVTSMRKFTENYKDFLNVTIKLSDLYKQIDAHEEYIRKVLNDLIYHNLDKISPIYKAVLGIDIGDISDLMRAVNKRHHIVHRNGKDKNGNELSITRQDISDLWDKVNALIINVNNQLAANHSVEG